MRPILTRPDHPDGARTHTKSLRDEFVTVVTQKGLNLTNIVLCQFCAPISRPPAFAEPYHIGPIFGFGRPSQIAGAVIGDDPVPVRNLMLGCWLGTMECSAYDTMDLDGFSLSSDAIEADNGATVSFSSYWPENHGGIRSQMSVGINEATLYRSNTSKIGNFVVGIFFNWSPLFGYTKVGHGASLLRGGTRGDIRGQNSRYRLAFIA